MNLNTKSWKGFTIEKLFYKLENGKANDTKLEDGTECIYIGAKKNDNGVMRRCAYNADLMQKGNCIIFICNGQGSVGYANYMDRDFIATTDVVAGYNDNLNEKIGVFIATVLCLERPKYSFGRKWKRYLRETVIDLPIQYQSDGKPLIDETKQYSSEGYIPDWKFMESYMSTLRSKHLTTTNSQDSAWSIDTAQWKEFRFGSLIKTIYKAHAYVKDELEEVKIDDANAIRYITRTAENNGCELIVNKESLEYIEKENAITIGDTTATCFYQSEPFVTGDHMVVIRAEWLDEIVGIFITTILNKEQYKYSYGRAFIMDRIKETIIKLPVQRDNNGEPIIDSKLKYSDKGYQPDWNYMRSFLRSLPYGDRLN